MTIHRAVPRPPHAHIARPGLVQRLDEASGTAVRVVWAPAGYGKTQLLAEWARARPEGDAVMWISGEAAPSEEAFWRAVAEQLPDAGADGDPAATPRRIAALGRPVAIVIDRFDRVERRLAEDLCRWATSTDDVALLVSTRERPAPALTVAFDVAVMLTADDLSFTADETGRLAAALGARVGDSTAATLTREAEGWPVAIRIALQEVAEGSARSWLASGDTVAEAHRVLLAMLQRLPGFAALRLAAVAEFVTAELAAELGFAEDLSVLDGVVELGWGWWEEQDGERRFRVHPVVRRALREALTADEWRRANGALARWLAARGEPGPAFGAAIDAERWDLARYFAYTAFTDVTAFMVATPDLLARVPASVARADPMLGFLTALWHYGRGRTARAVSALGGAFATTQRRRLLAPGRVTPERVWAQGLLTAGLRLSGGYELVEPALRRFESMLDSAEDPEGLLAPAAGLFAREIAVTELYLGRLDEARHALARAPREPRRTKKEHFYADALDALILTRQGRFREAEQIVDRLREEGLPPGFEDSFYGIPLMLAQAALHLEMGAAAHAAAALARTEPHWSTTENWPLLLIAHAETAWYRDDALSGLDVFDLRHAEQHRRARIGPAMSALLRALRAQLLMAAGRVREARQLIGAHGGHHLLAVTNAQILLAEGRLSEASAAAEASLRSPGTDPRTRVDLLLVMAAGALRADDAAAAARPFRHAAELGMRHGMRSPFARLSRDERRRLLDEIAADPAWREALLAPVGLLPEAIVLPRLTKKELVALQDIALGTSLPAAAERHRVSVNTVKAQRRTLYRKLGVGSASDAVARARELGLL